MAYAKKVTKTYAPPGGSMPIEAQMPMAKGKKPPKENALPRHAMHKRGRNRGM